METTDKAEGIVFDGPGRQTVTLPIEQDGFTLVQEPAAVYPPHPDEPINAGPLAGDGKVKNPGAVDVSFADPTVDRKPSLADIRAAVRELGESEAQLAAKTAAFERAAWTPAALGKSVQSVDDIDLIPWRGSPGMEVTLQCTEFTSLCPVTGQRDMGTLRITYAPRRAIVETKSLKLWLSQFADKCAFNEVLVDAVCNHLASRLDPAFIEVEGTFNVRGGIVPIARTCRYAEGSPKNTVLPTANQGPSFLGSAVE
jgi:7-cyano-7-deazaguanine reductase